MKRQHIHIASCLLLTCLLAFSCTSELDETKTFTELADPTYLDADLYRLQITPTIEDQEVTVKLISDEFELTQSIFLLDNILSIEIPNAFDSGYILIGIDRRKTIVLEYENDISLLPEFFEPPLFGPYNEIENFNADSLIKITGRVVDENNIPLEGMTYHISFWGDGVVEFHGMQTTDEEGTISYITTFRDTFNRVIIDIKKPGDLCSETLNIDRDIDSQVINLGDQVFEKTELSVLELNVRDVSQCQEELKVTGYYLTQRNYSVCHQELDEVGITYCENSVITVEPTTPLFVCTHTPSFTHFDGYTYLSNPLSTNHEFDSCLPAGFFFEMTNDFGQILVDGVVYDTTLNRFSHQDLEFGLVKEDDFYNHDCGESECDSEYHFNAYQTFQMSYTPDLNWQTSSHLFMHNFVDNEDELVGIMTNYNNSDFKIRYRIPKI